MNRVTRPPLPTSAAGGKIHCMISDIASRLQGQPDEPDDVLGRRAPTRAGPTRSPGPRRLNDASAVSARRRRRAALAAAYGSTCQGCSQEASGRRRLRSGRYMCCSSRTIATFSLSDIELRRACRSAFPCRNLLISSGVGRDLRRIFPRMISEVAFRVQETRGAPRPHW